MKMQIVGLLGIAMFFSTIGSLSAQRTTNVERKLQEIDTNNDQMVSMAELKTYRINQLNTKGKEFSEERFTKRFAKADADGDGLLNESEIKRARKFLKTRKERR